LVGVPVDDVAMRVDEAGHRRHALGIDGRAGAGRGRGPNRCDPSAAHDDRAAFDDLAVADEDAGVGDHEVLGPHRVGGGEHQAEGQEE
jgi:hypothetical protein